MILAVLLWKLGDYETSVSPESSESSTAKNTPVGSSVEPTGSNRSLSPDSNTSLNPKKEESVSQEADQILVRQFEIESAQTRKTNAIDSASKFISELVEASNQYQELQRSIVDLETNELGSKIASSSESTKRFLAFRTLVTPLIDQSIRLQEEQLLLEKQMRFIETKSPQSLVSDLVSKLDKMRPIFAEFSQTLESRKRGLAAIVNESSKREIGNVTLSDRIHQLAIEEEDRAIDAARAMQEKQLAEKDSQRVDAENRRKANEIEAEKAKAAAVQAKIETEARARALQEEEDRQKIALKAELKRDWPKVEHYLGTLFAKSTSQPSNRGLIETKEAMPVSLSGLKQFGSLIPQRRCNCGMLSRSYRST